MYGWDCDRWLDFAGDEKMKILFWNELYYIEIKVLVKDLENLDLFMNDLNSLPEIIDVERVIRWGL